MSCCCKKNKFDCNTALMRVFVLVILLHLNSFSQKAKPDFVITLELQEPNGGNMYEYHLDSNSDELNLDITQSEHNFSGKLKLSKKTSSALFENAIKAFENNIIEPKQETGLYCNYKIRCSIRYNYQSKTLCAKDKYYVNQLLSFFTLLNEQVTKPYQIPLSKFEFTQTNSFQKTEQLPLLSIKRNYKIHDTGTILYKNVYDDGTRGDTLQIISSTPKGPEKSKTELVILSKSVKDSLYDKSILYINSFHFNHTLVTKNPNFENEYFTVSYYTIGVEFDIEFGNFKLTELTIQCKDFIRFLNTSVTPKEPFR